MKPFPMEPVAEPWAMRRIRERLASVYPVVSNTTARNSRVCRMTGVRPAAAATTASRFTCLSVAQYDGGIAAANAEAARRQNHSKRRCISGSSMTPESRVVAVQIYYDPDKNSIRVTGKTFDSGGEWDRNAEAASHVSKRSVPAGLGQWVRDGRPQPHGPPQQFAYLLCG